MSDQPNASPFAQPPRKRPFQFSLAKLFAVQTVVAVVVSVIVSNGLLGVFVIYLGTVDGILLASLWENMRGPPRDATLRPWEVRGAMAGGALGAGSLFLAPEAIVCAVVGAGLFLALLLHALLLAVVGAIRLCRWLRSIV